MDNGVWGLAYQVVEAMEGLNRERERICKASEEFERACEAFARAVPEGKCVPVTPYVVISRGVNREEKESAVTVLAMANDKDLFSEQDKLAAAIEDAQRKECANGEPHAPLAVPEPDAKSWVPPDHSTD